MSRIQILLLVALFSGFVLNAQIINGGFEEHTGTCTDAQAPICDLQTTLNAFNSNCIPGWQTPIYQIAGTPAWFDYSCGILGHPYGYVVPQLQGGGQHCAFVGQSTFLGSNGSIVSNSIPDQGRYRITYDRIIITNEDDNFVPNIRVVQMDEYNYSVLSDNLDYYYGHNWSSNSMDVFIDQHYNRIQLTSNADVNRDPPVIIGFDNLTIEKICEDCTLLDINAKLGGSSLNPIPAKRICRLCFRIETEINCQEDALNLIGQQQYIVIKIYDESKNEIWETLINGVVEPDNLNFCVDIPQDLWDIMQYVSIPGYGSTLPLEAPDMCTSSPFQEEFQGEHGIAVIRNEHEVLIPIEDLGSCTSNCAYFQPEINFYQLVCDPVLNNGGYFNLSVGNIAQNSSIDIESIEWSYVRNENEAQFLSADPSFNVGINIWDFPSDLVCGGRGEDGQVPIGWPSIYGDEGEICLTITEKFGCTKTICIDLIDLLSDNNGPRRHSNNIDQQNREIQIFPNPANHLVNIHFGEESLTKRVRIYSNLGQLVQTINIADMNHFIINVAEWSPGIYFLHFENAHENITVKRFVVTK